jgi:hypothetical protein
VVRDTEDVEAGRSVEFDHRSRDSGSGHLKRYIKTSRVWCAWQDGKVLVHVRMRYTSAEHVTVNWYPRYSIRAGGVHGDGFSSAQSDGSDAGEVRELITKQDPRASRTTRGSRRAAHTSR